MFKTTKTITLIAAIISLVGCASQPQTVDELRNSFKQGGMFLKTETHTIKRPLKAVVNSFHKKAVSCFNGIKTMTEWKNGYYSTSSTSYLAVLKQENKNWFAFTIQDNIGNAVYVGGVPKGGPYNFLADIEKINRSTTKVTLNGISMKSTKYFDSILAWAKGKNAECPL